MFSVVLVLHLMIVCVLVGVVLLQRSEGGALGGLGGSGGGISGFMTGRGAANVLTRTTAILALGFFITSIALSAMSGGGPAPKSLINGTGDSVPGPAQPAPSPIAPAPVAPSAPLPQ